MASAQQAHALTDYYIVLYQKRYGNKPVINRNKARWSWDNILHDYKPADIKVLLDYYFAHDSVKSHDLEAFFYNYDKIILSMQKANEDKAQRAKLLKESEERARKWREKVERQRN